MFKQASVPICHDCNVHCYTLLIIFVLWLCNHSKLNTYLASEVHKSKTNTWLSLMIGGKPFATHRPSRSLPRDVTNKCLYAKWNGYEDGDSRMGKYVYLIWFCLLHAWGVFLEHTNVQRWNENIFCLIALNKLNNIKVKLHTTCSTFEQSASQFLRAFYIFTYKAHFEFHFPENQF